MEISQILLHRINPFEKSDLFVQYLDRPLWFKENFQEAFDRHRKHTKGIILLAAASEDLKENQEIIHGCIYVESKSHHSSFGKKIPIFGWLQAKNVETCKFLLESAEELVQNQGYKGLRGPINEPHLYGGWGAAIKKSSTFPIMVNTPQNPIILNGWIESSGFERSTTYLGLDTKTVSYPPNTLNDNEFRFISPTFEELKSNPELQENIKSHIKRNFGNFLPDHNSGTFEDAFAVFQQVENGNDFYLFMQDKATNQIVGLIEFIPNIFQKWQGQPITIINSASSFKSFLNSRL